jgi:energy-coupling factor transporter ATP-binding protein EcfA2
MNCLYSLKNISLSYPALGGLDDSQDRFILGLIDISLDIHENEFLVILGANGSGKSSLGKLLAGLADNVSGEIYFKGKKVSAYSRNVFNTVSLVLQEPQNQLLMPTVAKELAFPLENRGVEKNVFESRVARICETFRIENLLDKSPDELSGGQITTVALAAGLITDPEIIILDEPDSHFDLETRNSLNRFLGSFRGRKTIIVITQFVELAAKADRVIIMDNGRLTAYGKPEEIKDDILKLSNNSISDSLSNISHSDKGVKSEVKNVKSDKIATMLSLENVSYSYKDNTKVLKEINIDIVRGEKIAFVGPSGAGKTTLGLLMAGLLTSQDGRIYIDNKSLTEYSAFDLRRKITMAMQLPERAIFEETVAADIGFGPGNLKRDNIESIINEYLVLFNLQALRDRHPFSLSGGEKRKTALAGVMAMESEVIILDEPSGALDPKATKELIDILNKSTGRTFIIISHDRDFISQTATRIIGMHNGSVEFDLPAGEYFNL